MIRFLCGVAAGAFLIGWYATNYPADFLGNKTVASVIPKTEEAHSIGRWQMHIKVGTVQNNAFASFDLRAPSGAIDSSQNKNGCYALLTLLWKEYPWTKDASSSGTSYWCAEG